VFMQANSFASHPEFSISVRPLSAFALPIPKGREWARAVREAGGQRIRQLGAPVSDIQEADRPSRKRTQTARIQHPRLAAGSGGKRTLPVALLEPEIAHCFPVRWEIIERIESVEMINRQVANLIH